MKLNILRNVEKKNYIETKLFFEQSEWFARQEKVDKSCLDK